MGPGSWSLADPDVPFGRHVRALVLPLVVLLAAFGERWSDPVDASRATTFVGTRVAALKDSLPGLFLGVVNRLIRGRVAPRRIVYRAPATLLLEDTIVTDPDGGPVAHVKRAEIDVAVTPLLLGDIVVTRLHLDEPRLLLERKEGKLNLLEAFGLKDPGQPKKDNNGGDLEVRVENIRVSGGGLRFKDGANLTVTADDIDLGARVEVDMKSALVTVAVERVSVAKSSVRLPELDVPIRDLRVERLGLVGDRLDIEGARGSAAGAAVTARGGLALKGAGRLDLTGHIDAPPGTWPERLAPPPFPLPKLGADVKVTGPLADPQVSLDGTFEAFTAYEYRILGGTARVGVSKDRVDVQDARARLEGGALSSSGTLGLPALDLDLDVRTAGVPLAVVLGPAKLDPAPRGKVSGALKVRGVADGKSPLDVGGALTAVDAQGFGVTPPSPLKVELDLAVSAAEVLLRSVVARATGAEATVQGTARLDSRDLDLNVAATATTPLRLVEGAPAELKVAEGRFTGKAAGPFDKVRVEGDVRAAGVEAWGVPAPQLFGRLAADAAEVRVSRLSGRVAGGALSGRVRLDLRARERALAGEVVVKGADLGLLKAPDGGALPVQGRAAVRARLDGVAAAPVVSVSAKGTALEVEGQPLGALDATLVVTKEELRATALSLDGELVRASSVGPVTFAFEDQRVRGDLDVDVRDLAKVRAAAEAKLAGRARGRLRLSGSVPSPDVTAWLQVSGLSVLDEALGTGPLVVRLLPDPTSTPEAPRRMAQASGRLASERGALDVRASYSLERERVNGVVRFTDVDVGALAARIPSLATFSGRASGQLRLRGPKDALDADVELRVPSLTIPLAEPKTTERRSRVLTVKDESSAPKESRVRGPVALQARLERGKLDALVCAFEALSPPRGSPCGGREDLWLRARGDVSQADASFDLVVEGRVAYGALQELVLPLREHGARAAVITEGTARVRLPPGAKAPSVEGDVVLLAASVELEDTPPAKLESPARISFGADRVVLRDPVRFDVGGSGVTLRGGVTGDAVDLEVDGKVALALAKVYLDEISNASGTAQAQLSLKGARDAPVLRGHVIPDPGASITSRSLRERVELTGGRLEVSPLRDSASQHVIHASELSMRIGEGSAVLDGDVDLETADLFAKGQVTPMRFDLVARGNGLTVNNGRTWAETSFNVGLRSKPRAEGGKLDVKLSGQLEVNDGLLRERFEMQNFVLTTRPGRPSEPLSKVVMDALRADEVLLDVDVVVHSFRVRADIVSFPLDAVLAGNLRLENSLRVPSLAGAIEVVDGVVSFPRARMEVTEARVEFPRERAGLEPKILLVARGELPPEGQCDAEIPVKLTLEGDELDRIQMDLIAEESGNGHTRTHLLAAILLGRPLPECSQDGGLADPNAALRAVSSELTAGLTREIEDFVARELGSEVQVSLFLEEGRVGTDVRWRLSKRLELEGETGFRYREAGSAKPDEERPVGSNARARLLLLDHLPLSGDLFLEGGFAAAEGSLFDANTAAELKLKYRVFEY